MYYIGFAIEIPDGYVGLIFLRSSVYRTLLSMPNCVGVIDSDFLGELTARFSFCDDTEDSIPFKGQFQMEFHDLLTDDGIAEFCRTNINPNCVPGLVVGIGPLFLKSLCTSDEWLERGNLLSPWLGMFTDYGERNRGVIMAKQISEILAEALRQVSE